MAQKKQIKFIDVGPFDGPIQNGKFQNWEALCTIDDGKGGRTEVVVQLGSEGMSKKFKPGTYTGFFCGKTDSDLWKVCVQAQDNEGLGAPQDPQRPRASGGGSQPSGGGGRSYNNDSGIMACAVGLVKSLVEASQIKTLDESLSSVKEAFKDLKAFNEEIAQEGAKKDAAKAAAEKEKSEITAALKTAGLLEEVRSAKISYGDLKAAWSESAGNDAKFAIAISKLLPDVPGEEPSTDGAPETAASDDIPF